MKVDEPVYALWARLLHQRCWLQDTLSSIHHHEKQLENLKAQAEQHRAGIAELEEFAVDHGWGTLVDEPGCA